MRGGRYLPWMGKGGVPTSDRGREYLTLIGGGGTYLGQGRGTCLGVPPILTWLGGTYLGRGRGTYLGVAPLLPPGVDRQTPVKTVASRRTTCGGGNEWPM